MARGSPFSFGNSQHHGESKKYIIVQFILGRKTKTHCSKKINPFIFKIQLSELEALAVSKEPLTHEGRAGRKKECEGNRVESVGGEVNTVWYKVQKIL